MKYLLYRKVRDLKWVCQTGGLSQVGGLKEIVAWGEKRHLCLPWEGRDRQGGPLWPSPDLVCREGGLANRSACCNVELQSPSRDLKDGEVEGKESFKLVLLGGVSVPVFPSVSPGVGRSGSRVNAHSLSLTSGLSQSHCCTFSFSSGQAIPNLKIFWGTEYNGFLFPIDISQI